MPAGTCVKCGENLDNGPVVTTEGKKYHQDCFTCTFENCANDLFAGYHRDNEGNIFCSEHNPLKRSSLGTCAACDKDVQALLGGIYALNKVFHKACFHCSACQATLEKEFYPQENGALLCLPCHETKTGDKCSCCEKFGVGYFQVSLKTNVQTTMCPSCLTCHACKISLNGVKFYPGDDCKLFCEEHKEDVHKEKAPDTPSASVTMRTETKDKQDKSNYDSMAEARRISVQEDYLKQEERLSVVLQFKCIQCYIFFVHRGAPYLMELLFTRQLKPFRKQQMLFQYLIMKLHQPKSSTQNSSKKLAVPQKTQVSRRITRIQLVHTLSWKPFI
eukprot:m.210864 g.210864  ORF g.210864 m.210864 type:complete len:331 (-) comp15828_c0_seq2:1055-2047(-)